MKLHPVEGSFDLEGLSRGARLGAPRPLPAKVLDAGITGARKGHISRASSGLRADKLLRRFSWEREGA